VVKMFGQNKLSGSIDENFNLLIFSMLVLAFLGCIFVWIAGVQAGATTAILFLGGIALFTLMSIFLKDDDRLKPVTDFLRIPISDKLPLTCLLYLIGLATPLLIKGLFSILGSSFSVVNFSIPLFASDITSNTQSFSISQIADSEAWKLFFMVYVAGTNETWLFNLITPLVMSLIGIFLYGLLTDNKNNIFGFLPKNWFVLIFAFLTTSWIFTILHTFNNTYTGFGMYAVAFTFLLIANISIYVFGIFLGFWIGYHQMNNLMYLVEVDGLKAVLGGMFSFFGIIFVGMIVLILIYLFRKYKQTGKELKWWIFSRH
jgi:hypothetical protein